MSDLKTNLQEILQEKQEKIIPENIKKDVQIFDVVGTLEGGTTASGVKLFETEEEMQADSTAQEGDLAVVYREEIQNMTADTQTQYITFPETVVLPEAFTGDVYCTLRAVDESVMFDGQVMLRQSGFRFDGYSENGMIRIYYTSSDGVTYTRGEFMGDSGSLTNPVDLGTFVKVYMSEEWNDMLGYFMQVDGSYFGGLYQYKLGPIDDKIATLKISDIAIIEDGNSIAVPKQTILTGNYYVAINKLIEKAKSLYSDFQSGHINIDADTNIVKLYFSVSDAGAYVISPEIVYNYSSKYTNVKCFITCTQNYEIKCLTCDITTMTVSDLLDPTPFGQLNWVEASNTTNLCDCYDITNEYLVSNIEQGVLSTRFFIGSRTLGDNDYEALYDEDDNKYIVNELYYQPASTQLNLSEPNQILKDISAYGSNGIIIGDGSIYDNLSIVKFLNESFGINIFNSCAKLLYNRSDDYSKTYDSVSFEKGQYTITQGGIDNLVLLEPVCQYSSDFTPTSMIYSDSLYVLFSTTKIQVYDRQTNELLNDITIAATKCYTVQVNDNLAYLLVFNSEGGQILAYKLTNEFALVATKSTTSDTIFNLTRLVYNAPTNTIYFTYVYSDLNYIKCLRDDSFVDLASYTSVSSSYSTYLADAGSYVYFIYRTSTSDSKAYNNVVIDVETNTITTYTNNNSVAGGVSAIDDEGNYYYMNGWSGGNGPLVKVTPTSASVISKYAYGDVDNTITRWDYYDTVNNKIMSTNAYYMSSQITGDSEGSDVWRNRFWNSSSITISGQSITFSVKSNVTHPISINARGYDKFIIFDTTNKQIYIASNIKSVTLEKVENNNYIDIYNFLIDDMLFKLSNKKYEQTLSLTEYNTALDTSKEILGTNYVGYNDITDGTLVKAIHFKGNYPMTNEDFVSWYVENQVILSQGIFSLGDTTFSTYASSDGDAQQPFFIALGFEDFYIRLNNSNDELISNVETYTFDTPQVFTKLNEVSDDLINNLIEFIV